MDDHAVDATAPATPPLNARQVRARRRRRRRRVGVAVFVVVALGLFVATYFTFAGGDSTSEQRRATTAAENHAPTSTTSPGPFGPYAVTTGINVRQGPGTTFPTVGTIETGKPVSVQCVAQGQSVDGPAGPDPQWLKTAGAGPQGYVSAVYVSAGDDLRNGKIPACPA